MRFFKKISKIGFLNPKESENGFCISFLSRSIQDRSDHGTSKLRNRGIHSQSRFFGSFDAPWSEISWINLLRKETHNPFIIHGSLFNPLFQAVDYSWPNRITHTTPLHACSVIFRLPSWQDILLEHGSFVLLQLPPVLTLMEWWWVPLEYFIWRSNLAR